MDSYQKAYSDYLKERVRTGLDLHPDGCIAFVAGYKSAQQRIIALLEDKRDEHWIWNEVGHADAINQALALIKEVSQNGDIESVSGNHD